MPKSFRKRYGRAIGRASAATLGYIAGNVPGAYASVKAYDFLSEMAARTRPYTSNKRKYNSTKAWSSRRMKVRYPGSVPGPQPRAARKPKWARTKPVICRGVSVPKKLAKQIRCVAVQAIHDEQPTGKYFKHITGLFPKTASAEQTVEDRYFATGTSSTALSQLGVASFEKILDAVSVLFGVKSASAFYFSTNNLTPAQMIIPAFRHYVKYEFKNNRPIECEFHIYETVPKEDTNNTVAGNWATMSLVQKGLVTQNRLYYGMRPEMYPQFKDSYKILKKKTYRIAAGASIFYTMSQAADHVKFDDWCANGSSTPFSHRKNFTKELLIIEAEPLCGTTAAAAAPAIQNFTTLDQTTSFIGVFIKEIFSMKCPENINNTESKDNTICVHNNTYAFVAAGTDASWSNKTIEHRPVSF